MEKLPKNQQGFLNSYILANDNRDVMRKGGFIRYVMKVNDLWTLVNGGILIAIFNDKIRIKCWYLGTIIELKFRDCYIYYKDNIKNISKEENVRKLLKNLNDENIVFTKKIN